MNNRVHQGHLARKRFGQNFLNDRFVIDSIVSAINPQKGQAIQGEPEERHRDRFFLNGSTPGF